MHCALSTQCGAHSGIHLQWKCVKARIPSSNVSAVITVRAAAAVSPSGSHTNTVSEGSVMRAQLGRTQEGDY